MVPVSLGGADALVVAGGARFAAHAALLSAHSGYFRAALRDAVGRPLYVPELSAQQFWPLLAYMYTGHLDLSHDNVYQVLLAAHSLHMPRALELCRGFLEGRLPRGVVKPIPSRNPPLPPTTTSTSLAPRPTCAKFAETAFRRPRRRSTPAAPQPPAAPRPPPPEPQPEPPPRPPSASAATAAAEDKSSTVLDVACCDGPVRFHRVLNAAYGEDDSDDSYVEVEEDVPERREEGERARAPDDDSKFVCVYCNHSFKSQYCYQKHARRHLNPVSLDSSSSSAAEQSAKTAVAPKREVRSLDMNVQYYPCKTCGSKFPSYYFVHKHRKMCHADEPPDGETSATG